MDAKRNKVGLTDSFWTPPITKDEAISLYLSGTSIQQLAQICRCSTPGIHLLLNRNKIPKRQQGDIIRKYKINESYFNNIDTEEKAYFLGFLFADGDNNTKKHVVRLRIQEKDIEILQKLNSLIENESPVKVIPYNARNSYKNGQDVACLIINSKRLSNRLNELGCTSKKSFTVKYPIIPKYLNQHFIRGYFDGNGSFGITNSKSNGIIQSRFYFDIDGSDNILSVMQDVLVKELDLSITKRSIRVEHEEGKVVTLRYSGEQALKIMNWIYLDCKIKMDRKYQKYLCATH